MKLKMIKAPHLGQKDMICNTNYGTYAVDLGGTIEVSDAAGCEILGKWGTCFKQVLPSELAAKPLVAVAKVTKEVVSPDEAAALEATKVVKDYATKKV